MKEEDNSLKMASKEERRQAQIKELRRRIEANEGTAEQIEQFKDMLKRLEEKEARAADISEGRMEKIPTKTGGHEAILKGGENTTAAKAAKTAAEAAKTAGEAEEEIEKESRWKKTKKGAKVTGAAIGAVHAAATSSDILVYGLIFAGGFAHILRYWIWNYGGTIVDSFLAVWVGIVIFEKAKTTTIYKRILLASFVPICLFALSQGAIYWIIDKVPILQSIPGISFIFTPEYWPYWAVIGIWIGESKLNEILKLAHAMFIFWLVIWPIAGPLVEPMIAEARASREAVEAKGASYPMAYVACSKELISGGLSNLDLQTCIQRKMYPPTEEEVQARTIGQIKKALEQAVKASISINPGQLFFYTEGVFEEPQIIRGRVSATSLTNDINIALSCMIDNKTSNINPETFYAKASEIGDSTVFSCEPEELLKKRMTYNVVVTGDIPNINVNSVIIGFFIGEDALKAQQERFITSKDPENLRLIEEWSKLKMSPTYGVEKATNYLNQQIYKEYIKSTYPTLKVQSESDPGHIKLNLMVNRIYHDAKESSAVVGLSDTREAELEIGIENNQKDGKIIKVNSGIFDAFPPFLEPVEGKDCPIKTAKENDKYVLDPKILETKPWAAVKYQQEQPFSCKLRYNPTAEFDPEEITPAVFSLTLNYDYQIEKKGTFDVERYEGAT
jgi:hypothetical protein